MSAYAGVKRIDHTGSLYFGGALIAVSLVVAALLLVGWQRSRLSSGAQYAWWIGAVLNALGLAGIGYAGCPICWRNVPVARTQKSITIRAGLVLFLVGGWATVVAILI